MSSEEYDDLHYVNGDEYEGGGLAGGGNRAAGDGVVTLVVGT